MWFDLSLFTDDLFPENSTPRYARCCWQWASKNSQPKCWTRIYPSYLWHFVTPHFTQIFGQELKRSLHKYFGEKQRKIHFQYHIVGPERRYWNWISIHFLPSINHIWPPGANISEKLKYYHDRVWLEKKYLCSKMWKLASSNFERWKGNFELEKGNFQRWKGHFILVSVISKSAASWNRCLLIQVWSKLFWNRCNTRY